MRDGVAFAEDDGTFVAIYAGHSGQKYAGIGDDRAEALRSLADNLDPFADVDGEFTRACTDAVELDVELASHELFRDPWAEGDEP